VAVAEHLPAARQRLLLQGAGAGQVASVEQVAAEAVERREASRSVNVVSAGVVSDRAGGGE